MKKFVQCMLLSAGSVAIPLQLIVLLPNLLYNYRKHLSLALPHQYAVKKSLNTALVEKKIFNF